MVAHANETCIKQSSEMIPNSIQKKTSTNNNKSIKLWGSNIKPNRPKECQRVEKVPSTIRRRQVSGRKGSPGSIESRTIWPLDHPQRIPTRRWAEGPANIYIYIYPDAPCGAHTAATWFYGLRFVAADVVWKIAKCHTKFRGERSFLQVFRSSLPVLCGYFALSLVLDGLAELVPTAM